MTKVFNERQNSIQNRFEADCKKVVNIIGKNTLQSPRMSTMMNIAEKGRRYSPE